MGCGSSSLKGDSSVGTDQPAQPSAKSSNTLVNSNNTPKKPATQFEDVDYNHGRTRDPTKASFAADRAPDELDPTKQDVATALPDMTEDTRPSHHTRENRAVRDNSFSGRVDGATLKPYHTIDGDYDPDVQEEPTRRLKKKGNEMDPGQMENTDEARKKSLFQRLKDGREAAGKKRNSTTPYTDDELKEYTGLSREEFDRRLATQGNRIMPDVTPGYPA